MTTITAEGTAPEYLTRPEAAAFLSVTTTWLANSGKAAGIPQYKFGGSVRYSKTELTAWAKQQREA